MDGHHDSSLVAVVLPPEVCTQLRGLDERRRALQQGVEALAVLRDAAQSTFTTVVLQALMAQGYAGRIQEIDLDHSVVRLSPVRPQVADVTPGVPGE